MEDKILVNLSADLNHTFECPTNIIGREGEGNTTRFEITIPADFEGCSVYLDFKKPNGEVVRTSKLEVENNVAIYDVVPFLLTDDGEIKVQAVLKTDDEQTWKSSIKRYIIHNSINALEEIPDKDAFMVGGQKLLDELRQESADLAERKEAEIARVEAENARVEAENARADAETARAEAEIARADAELERVEAEKARADAQAEIASKIKDVVTKDSIVQTTGLSETAVMSQRASSKIYHYLNITADVKFTVEAGVEHYTSDHPVMLTRKKGETYFIKVTTDNPNPFVLYERSSANGNLAIMNLNAGIEYEIVASQDFESIGFYIAPSDATYTYEVHCETPETVSSARFAELKGSIVTQNHIMQTTGTGETAVMSQKATTEAIAVAEGKTNLLAEQVLGRDRNNFVTPQMFGSNATGSGQVDDTDAFYEALNHGNNIYLPEGTYIIDFRCVNLTGKVIRGASASKTTIMQKNSNVPFCQVGNGTMIENLTIHMRQNTERTACLVFGEYDGAFVPFTDHRIEKVSFNCDGNTVAFHYAMHTLGCVGGVVRDIMINSCHIGIWIDMTAKGWLTAHRFENFNIYRPQVAGVKITDADNQGQHTQSQYLNISVMNYIDGAIGFDIGGCGVMFVNPTCFIENSEGTTYSIKIDKSVALKQKQTPYAMPLFVGGLLEGKVINKDYLGLIKFDNCSFVTGSSLVDAGHTYPALTSTIRPITRDIVKDYGNNTSGISNSNATITHGTDEFGDYIELSRTDETKKASIIFNAGSNAVLGDEVINYPVSTFYSVVCINFNHTYLTQLYDTGLGNSTSFVTLRSRIDVPSADNDYLCIRTLIDDWTQHEQYKLHNMQMQIEAGAPTGSKVRIYKYCVNYGITPATQGL